MHMAAQDSLNNFTLPSKHALSRYFQSYADKLNRNYPMMHLPTSCFASAPLWLTLAVAAVGARYRMESKNGHSLYEAAMTLTMEQRRVDSLRQFHQMSDEHRTAMIQTLILLMSYGAWDWDIELLGGALDLQSVLASYVRHSLDNDTSVDALQWKQWIAVETHRRTISIAYAYLVMQSLTYDLPHVVMSSDIQELQLPCGTNEWEARSEHEWKDAARQSTPPVLVKDALQYLLGGSTSQKDRIPQVSSTGSFVLLLALIQRICVVRQLHSTSEAAILATELNTLQRALARWKAMYQQNSNFSLDPISVDGAVPWTSLSLLSLAYTRLHIDLGPCRQLYTRDPQKIATALLSAPLPDCSPEAIPALLHAAHTLSVPVMMGVDYVSRSQTLFWTCEQAVCGLESGVFLWKWLQSAGDSFAWHNLKDDEKGIISWVLFSVTEAIQSVGASEFELDDGVNVSELSFTKLGVLVLKIWARVFSGTSAWPLTQEIGKSLKLLITAAEAA